MTVKKMSMSKSKLSLIHVAKAKVGMTEEDYRAMLKNVAGASSAKDLTPAGFLIVMRHFERLGFERATEASDGGRRAGMATPEQVALIRSMWEQWSGQKNESSLRSWLERKYQVSAIRFTDDLTAKKAIEGLKAMLTRREFKGSK